MSCKSQGLKLGGLGGGDRMLACSCCAKAHFGRPACVSTWSPSLPVLQGRPEDVLVVASDGTATLTPDPDRWPQVGPGVQNASQYALTSNKGTPGCGPGVQCEERHCGRMS